jgi:cold shock protein
MEGTVKWYNIRKGYGFVKGEDGEDYFLHHTALDKRVFLRENDQVSFEATETDKGKQAVNVQLLKKGSERTDLEEANEEVAETKVEEFGGEEDAPNEEETSEDAEEKPAKEEETSEEEATEETEEPAEETKEAPEEEATEEPAEKAAEEEKEE